MKFRREVAREKKNSFLIFYQYILSLTYIKPTNEILKQDGISFQNRLESGALI